MEKDRLAAFSDGVIAVIITIMVLELKTPQGSDWGALTAQWPVFASYVLSFVYVGIYWNNHHHLFQVVERVNGAVLWANLHVLFWLSLIPFATSWVGEYHTSSIPTAAYGVALLMPAVAWYVLQTAIIRVQGHGSVLAQAVGGDLKGKISPVLYLAGIGAAFFSTWLADGIYAAVALIWLVPDRRIERHVTRG